jgi:hypothetical protein
VPTGAATVGQGDGPHLIALGRGSQRWNWFLAADYMGTWIVTKGIADVTFTRTGIEAVLYLSSELAPYHIISATIGSDRAVEAKISSPGLGRPQPFKLAGEVYFGEETDAGQSKSVLLTDGTTVLGLAFGRNSGKPNP